MGVLTVNIELMWRGLETGERRTFSESFQPFRAEPKITETPFGTSTVVPVRGVA